MAIKALIFDCFGVLVQPGRTLLYQSYPQFGIEIGDLEHQWHNGMLSRQEFNEQMAKLIGATPEEVKSRYYDISVRDEAAVDWVRQLKKAGEYKIGFLSNVGPSRMNEFFPKSELSELFDEVVLSYDVGMVKPEVAIFDLMAERLGLETSECIMIDDLAVNIDSAANAGMQTVLFISIDQARDEIKQILKA